ncbi:hypothetical protein [Larkinella arboricola]
MKTLQICLVLTALGVCLSATPLCGQSLHSLLTPSGNGGYQESLTEAERKLWKSIQETDFKRLKAQRFTQAREAQTAFTMKFDPKRRSQTLSLYYFIPRERLATKPAVQIMNCQGASTRLKKEIFTRDGLIVYEVFPLETPAGFSEDNVRFTASVPGKLVAFLK